MNHEKKGNTAMKPDYILFFTDTNPDAQVSTLLQSLKELHIQTYWNPDLEELPVLSKEHVLAVCDTEQGADFARQNQLPYIEKWNPEQSFTKKPAAICYYDAVSALTCEYLLNQWKRGNHLPLTIAKSQNLYLKELTVADYTRLYSIRQSASMVDLLPPLDSLEEEIEKHKHYITCQYEFFDYGLWGVYLNDDTLIGQAGIQNHEYNGQTMLELSYLIAPKYQRKGYATEAILAIYEYVISELEQNQLLAIIAKKNLPSIRTAMNLGMKRKEDVQHLGFDCNYYCIDNIHDFLIYYQSESKRRAAAKSAFRNAKKHPVQEVYSRYRK